MNLTLRHSREATKHQHHPGGSGLRQSLGEDGRSGRARKGASKGSVQGFRGETPRKGLVAYAQGQSQRGIPAARMAGEKMKQEGEGWDHRLVSPGLRDHRWDLGHEQHTPLAGSVCRAAKIHMSISLGKIYGLLDL